MDDAWERERRSRLEELAEEAGQWEIDVACGEPGPTLEDLRRRRFGQVWATEIMIELRRDEPGRARLHMDRRVIDAWRARRRLLIDGVRVEADEIVIPTDRFWRDRAIPPGLECDWREPWSPPTLEREGWVDPVWETLDLWICPCPRRFATPAALAAHRCPILPPKDDEEPTASEQAPKAPFTIKGLDWPDTVRILRMVLDLTEQDLTAAEIGRELGPEVGDHDVNPITVRSWRSIARSLRAQGRI